MGNRTYNPGDFEIDGLPRKLLISSIPHGDITENVRETISLGTERTPSVIVSLERNAGTVEIFPDLNGSTLAIVQSVNQASYAFLEWYADIPEGFHSIGVYGVLFTDDTLLPVILSRRDDDCSYSDLKVSAISPPLTDEGICRHICKLLTREVRTAFELIK